MAENGVIVYHMSTYIFVITHETQPGRMIDEYIGRQGTDFIFLLSIRETDLFSQNNVKKISPLHLSEKN